MADDKVLDTLVKKVEGLADDVRSNSYRLDKLENRIDNLETKIDQRFDTLGIEIRNLTGAVHTLADTVSTMSRQFAAVTSKVIEHDDRINSVESRVAVLETH